ncbi:MAG: glycosyltransferase family 61 protein [Alphaproteobacteria bacterium]|nr:glycosyltransferase family 61 protein [Alphaproteobacteria bacterium]
MAIRKWSMRNLRWEASRRLVRALPPLRASVILYEETVAAADAGTVLDTLVEEHALTFSESERWLIDHLPRSVAWQEVPDVLRREVRLIHFADHTLLGDTGSLVNERTERLVYMRGMRDFANYHSFRPFPLKRVEKADATYVNMMGSWRGHRHLFHFLLDRFPRLYYLLERFGYADRPVRLVVHADMPAYQEDLYRFVLARYPNVELARLPGTERWHIRDLVVVENWQNTKSTLADGAALAFTRGLFLEGYGISPALVPGRRLYVSREDTRKRRTRNEAELRARLARHGFEPVLAGQLSFPDQVRAFAGAEFVAGTHGAGLTNILFAPPAMKLLEIFPQNKLRNTYFLLSRSLGQPYAYVVAGPAGAQEAFEVDPDAVERTLADLLS